MEIIENYKLFFKRMKMDLFQKYVDFTELLNEWEPCQKAIMDLALPKKWQMDYGGEGAYFTFQYWLNELKATIYLCPQNDIIDIQSLIRPIPNCVTHKLSTFDVVVFKKEVHEKLGLTL